MHEILSLFITRDQKKSMKQEDDTCHAKREVEEPNKTKVVKRKL
jgi:hypothetical protein